MMMALKVSMHVNKCSYSILGECTYAYFLQLMKAQCLSVHSVASLAGSPLLSTDANLEGSCNAYHAIIDYLFLMHTDENPTGQHASSPASDDESGPETDHIKDDSVLLGNYSSPTVSEPHTY